ncbi:autotransporter outer membrane beta-barrel domain-containing protein [Cetobacterium sp. SF1]|uniref:autotransporter family protein n=1 Tax=Cetobacterium sp. SF1 TaxID=3417654 RepID=UPI003CF6E46B
MSSKLKLLFLSVLLGSAAQGAVLPTPTVKDSVAFVSDWSSGFVVRFNKTVEIEGGKFGSTNGNKVSKLACWTENFASFEVYGKLLSQDQQYNSDLVGVLFAGVNNNLYKEDTLLYFETGAQLGNYGTIEMGSLIHDLSSNGIILGGSLTGNFADYKKSVAKGNQSILYNDVDGLIRMKGDTFSYTTYVNVDLLTYTAANYEKNVMDVSNKSILRNDGLIELASTYNPQLQSYVGVNLLKLGLRYNRNDSGIKSENSIIENRGTVLVKGDLYKATSTGGVNIGLLGADFIGYHEKVGIKGANSYIINSGTIEVERDFIKMEVNGTLADLTVTDGPLLNLGLLSFKNMGEKSVGVQLSGGKFINNNGTIKVGANSKNTFIGTDYAAIAFEGDNGALFEINGGKIELDGASIYATNLKNNSHVIFKGDTTITSLKNGKEVNTALFSNDKTSGHTIEGKLTVNGDLVVTKGNNINISLDDKNNFGQLVVDKLQLDGNIGVDGTKLAEKKINSISGDSLIVAKEGITGNGQLVSSNYMFDISENRIGQFDSNGQELVGVTINRKDFNEIVTNKELGKILEETYNSDLGNQNGLYSVLAQAKNEKEFDKTIKELNGERNINSLGFQVYNINKELNNDFYDFAKSSLNIEGMNVAYIGSESSVGSSNSSDGFKRKSNGVVLAYNMNSAPKVNYGLGFAYVNSKVDYDSNNSQNKIETWNFRGYRNQKLSKMNLFSELSLGINKSDNSRNAVAQGFRDSISGDVNVYTIGLNNNLSKEFKITDKLSIIPNGGVNLTYMYQDSYKEKSGQFNVNLDSVNSFFVEGALGTDVNYEIYKNGSKSINLIFSGKYAYDFIDKSEDLKETLDVLGDNKFSITGRDMDKNSIKLKAGIEFNLNESLGLDYSYTKEVLNKVESDRHKVGVSYRFN